MVKVNNNLSHMLKSISEKESELLDALDAHTNDLKKACNALFEQAPLLSRYLRTSENILPDKNDGDFRAQPLTLRSLSQLKVYFTAVRLHLDLKVGRVFKEAMAFDKELRESVARIQTRGLPMLAKGIPPEWEVLNDGCSPLSRIESLIRARITWLRRLVLNLSHAQEQDQLVGPLIPPAVRLVEDNYVRMSELTKILKVTHKEFKMLVLGVTDIYETLLKIHP